MKNSNDTIGNQNRDLPSLALEAQPSVSPIFGKKVVENNICFDFF